EMTLRDELVRSRAVGHAAVSKLWDACLLPDYRKVSPASHAELVSTIYGYLTSRSGRIPSDWFAAQVAQADRTDGEIDTLSTRIAHIRTWTFAANRPDWVDDPVYWQAQTRQVEDKLSDALHERLTRRFVDRRTSVLMRRLRENVMLEAEITKTGDVMVEGQHVGRLEGFRFAPDPAAGDGEAGRALRQAATKALASEIDARAEKLSSAADDAFILSNDGTIRWRGEAVAKLAAGDRVLNPRVRILADEHLTGAPRDQVEARLDLWLHAQIEKLLGPVIALEKAEELTGLARGLAYQLAEGLGVLERQPIAETMKQLDQDARGALRKLGVRFGAYHIFLPATLKPAPRALALQLHLLHANLVEQKALDVLPGLAASGRTSIAVDPEIGRDLYRFVGFRALGPRAVRVDILERLADIIRPALAWKSGGPGVEPAGHFPGGGFTVTVSMTSLVGCAGEDFAAILKGLGYRMEKRPAPPKPVVPAPSEAPGETAETVDTSEATEAQAETPVEAAVEEVATEPAAVSETVEAAAETAPAEPEAAPAPAEASAEDAPATEAAADAPVVATEAAEPTLVEVWRPGGRMEGAPPRHQQNRGPRRDGQRPDNQRQGHQRPGHQRPGAPTTASSDAPATEGGTDRPQRDHGRPPREGGWQRREGGAGADGEKRDGRPARKDFSKFQNNRGQDNRGQDNRRDGRPEGSDQRPDRPRRDDRPHKGAAAPVDRAPRKEKEPDPLSPFAKLAALKEAMTKKS
ncbi:MAG: helicase, partial [Alphaproteobacteria bacterium]